MVNKNDYGDIIEPSSETFNLWGSERLNNTVRYLVDAMSEVNPEAITQHLADIAINVKKFNVKGDGVTDDTIALKALISSLPLSCVLHFPDGVYLISDTLTFADLNKIKIIGSGIIKLKNNSANEIQLLKFLNCKSIDVSEITLDGNSSNQVNSHHSMSIMGITEQVILQGLTVKNINSIGFSVGDGIYIASNCKFKIIGCHFENIGRNGIAVVDGGNGTIDGNTFVNIKYLAVDVESNTGANAFNCIINANNIVGCAGGINAKGTAGNGQSKNVVITNNLIETTPTGIREGIAISDASDCIIEGNVIDTAYNIGILIEATAATNYASTVVENVLLKNNVVTHRYSGVTASFYPLWVRSFHATKYVQHVKIEGNTFKGVGHTASITGVILTKSQFVDVSNNTISNMGGVGLLLQDSKNIHIIENVVLNNGQLGVATQGIRANNCDVVIIKDNISTDNQTTKTQKYGVYVNASTNVRLNGNYLKGNETAEKFNDVPIEFDNSFTNVTSYGVAAPTSGAYKVNDRIVNTNPSELGVAGSKYIITGWVCVLDGTPGNWVALRSLTGN